MKEACNSTFFAPPPGEGQKRVNIIKFQLQSQFQRFLNQTLCGFSQMKDIQHIRQDFHSAVGGGGGGGVQKFIFSKFNQIWCVSYSHERHVQRHNF